MRTYEQVHFGPANWEVGKQLREYLAPKNIGLIVNGGINSGQQAKDVLAYTGADGVMVAQPSLGNPFIFREIRAVLGQQPIPTISTQDRISTALSHAKLMLEHKGPRGIIEMRKHLLWYFKGFPGAAELRKQLAQIETLEQLEQIFNAFPVYAL
jgi:tRNA-dihydrouridine synthase